MAGDKSVSVQEVAERERYQAQVDGEPAGFLTYRRVPDRTVLAHTEVDDRFEGQGVGSALARAALDGERALGRQIEPRCSFVAAYIRRHPEYTDLVPEKYRGQLEG